MPKVLKTLLWLVFGIAVFVGVAAAFRQTQGDLDLSLLHFSFLPFCLAALTFVISFLYTAFIWHDFLELTGAASSRTRDAGIWLVSQFGKYVPGNVAVVGLRMVQSSHRKAAVATSFIYEAAISVGAGLVASVPLLPASAQRVWIIALAAAGSLILFLKPDLMQRSLNWFLRLVRREPLATAPPSRLQILRLFSLFFLFWLLAGTSFWLFVSAVATPIPWLYATAVCALAWITGFLAIAVPSGVGVRESVLLLFLAPTLGTDTAVVLAASHRVFILVFDLAVSGAGFLLVRSRTTDQSKARAA